MQNYVCWIDDARLGAIESTPFERRIYFLGRYELALGPAVHKSATSLVIFADDHAAEHDYALAFEDVEWLSGDDPDGLVLTAEGASELALPVSLEYAELWGMVQAVRGQDDIDFGLDGSFGFDTPIGPLDIPYDERGGFPAPRRPEISLKKVKLKDLSLQGASFDVKLDVDNDHGSNLFFQNLDYELSLAGVDVGGGFIDDWGTVEGANQQTLSIPVEVSFAQAGTALYQVLQGEQLKVDIAGDVDVDTPFGIVPLEFDRSKQVSLER